MHSLLTPPSIRRPADDHPIHTPSLLIPSSSKSSKPSRLRRYPPFESDETSTTASDGDDISLEHGDHAIHLILSQSQTNVHCLGSMSASSHGSFESFVRDYVNNMSKNATSKRGKRVNAVNLFSATNSTVFQNKIHESYTQVFESLDSDDHDKPLAFGDNKSHRGLEHHIQASQHIVGQFFNLVQDGTVQAMHHYLPSNVSDEGYPSPAVSIFFHVEEYILANSSNCIEDLEIVLTPLQASKVIAWLDSFLHSMKDLCPEISVSMQWQSDLEQLWQFYLSHGVIKSVRQPIEEGVQLWCVNGNASESRDAVDNVGQNDNDIVVNADGELKTNHPEQIVNAIHKQITFAVQNLSPSRVALVWSVCCDDLSTMVADLMLHVSTSWRTTTTMRLCIIVNDALRFSSMISLLFEQHSEFVFGDIDHTASAEKRVESDLKELSTHAVHYLCERIVYSQLDPLQVMLSSVGSLCWERDTKGRAISRIVAIFRDSLTCLEGWLDSRSFPEVLQKVFELSLQIYVESFFCNTLTNGMGDAAAVAENLGQDYLNLMIFFNGSIFQKYDGKSAGFNAATIKSRLFILQSLARLVNPSIAPSDLMDDTIRILDQMTRSGDQCSGASILHIAGMRQVAQERLRSNDNENVKPIDWLRMIASAEKALLEQRREKQYRKMNAVNGGATPSTTCITKLPDLRNSTFTSQLKVGRKELHREISEASMPAAEAMLQLIISPTLPPRKTRYWQFGGQKAGVRRQQRKNSINKLLRTKQHFQE